MKITSKQFYQELRTVLAPMMKGNGFKNLKGGTLGWTRPTGNGDMSLWFQCDKWGWNERWGSKFTLQFQIAPEPCNALIPSGRFDRIGFVLEGFTELDELRIKNNAVIARLPGTINNQVVTQLLPDGTVYLSDGYKVDPKKTIYGSDIWLHYFSTEYVRDWAQYFQKNLIRFIELFECDIRSEQGMARLRFDKMMSLVQNTKDRSEKARIFEHFIATEQDPEFRTSAQRWLATLQEVLGSTTTNAANHTLKIIGVGFAILFSCSNFTLMQPTLPTAVAHSSVALR